MMKKVLKETEATNAVDIAGLRIAEEKSLTEHLKLVLRRRQRRFRRRQLDLGQAD